MAEFFHPLMYDEVAQMHREALPGVKIDPSHFPVSAKADNAVSVEADGLYAPEVEFTDILSKITGNYLRFGSDGGLFLDGNDVLSNEANNLIGISQVDGKIYFDPYKLLPSQDSGNALRLGTDGKFYVDPKALVSTDADNSLIPGTDGRLYVKLPDAAGLLSTGPNELLFLDDKNKLAAQVELKYDTASGLLSMLDRNGNTVASATVAAASSLVSVTVVTDPIGMVAGKYLEMVFRLSDGADKTVYVSLQDLVDVMLPGQGLDIIGNVASVKIAVESGLSFNASGALFVVADELRSHDPQNILTVSPNGKLQVLADTIMGVIKLNSADAGNLLTLGSDGGLYLPAAGVTGGIISDAPGNLLKPGTDGKLFIDDAMLGSGVSADAGNILGVGSDGRPFWDGDYGSL